MADGLTLDVTAAAAVVLDTAEVVGVAGFFFNDKAIRLISLAVNQTLSIADLLSVKNSSAYKFLSYHISI